MRQFAMLSCVCCCMQTCKAKDGDTYSTLAGTKLTVVKDSAAHNGRKLRQVGSWCTAACLNSLPLTGHCGPEQVALPTADAGTSLHAVVL